MLSSCVECLSLNISTRHSPLKSNSDEKIGQWCMLAVRPAHWWIIDTSNSQLWKRFDKALFAVNWSTLFACCESCTSASIFDDSRFKFSTHRVELWRWRCQALQAYGSDGKQVDRLTDWRASYFSYSGLCLVSSHPIFVREDIALSFCLSVRFCVRPSKSYVFWGGFTSP